MEFKDRLKEKRLAAGYSQSQLASLAGVGLRTIQNYESGARTRIGMDIAIKLASALNVSVDELLDTAQMHVATAYDRGGEKDARYVERLVSEVSALFAGGELDSSEKAEVMNALNRAYLDTLEDNQKYTPKKYKRKG